MTEKDTSRWLQLQIIFMTLGSNKDSSRTSKAVDLKDSTQIGEQRVKRTL
jgi:hypothetical protein